MPILRIAQKGAKNNYREDGDYGNLKKEFPKRSARHKRNRCRSCIAGKLRIAKRK